MLTLFGMCTTKKAHTTKTSNAALIHERIRFGNIAIVSHLFMTKKHLFNDNQQGRCQREARAFIFKLNYMHKNDLTSHSKLSSLTPAHTGTHKHTIHHQPMLFSFTDVYVRAYVCVSLFMASAKLSYFV